MKALHMRVLGRPAGLNMANLDPLLHTPGEKMTAGELGAVSTTRRKICRRKNQEEVRQLGRGSGAIESQLTGP